MDIRTKNSLAYLILGLSLCGTAWAFYDSYERVKSFRLEDQVITFGEGTTIPGNEGAKDLVSLDRTINTHLFGVVPPPPPAPKAVEPPKPKVVEAPKTKLNLRLTGIVSGSASVAGFAMIELSRNETSVVTEGGEIGKTGATLHKILSDHVLIDHRGSIERLNLERAELRQAVTDSTGAVTVKELDLSAAELAALAQVSAPVESQGADRNSTAQAAQAENVFTDENYVFSEQLGQEVQNPLQAEVAQDQAVSDDDESENQGTGNQ